MSAPLQMPVAPDHANLINFLNSMTRTVQQAVEHAVKALLNRDENAAGAILLNEPRINALEIVIDEQAVKQLGTALPERDVRLMVATIKINNDLERMGDLAVSIAQRVIDLKHLERPVEAPEELEPMARMVERMVEQALSALRKQDIALATNVLESDDIVDNYRDRLFAELIARMSREPQYVKAGAQFMLASRYLERIADHATNVSEDVIFWIRGLDVRHGRGLAKPAESVSVAD